MRKYPVISTDPAFVVQRIILPPDPADIPQIIGWCGPARSGTTALLFLMSGHSQVDKSYFQPQSTILRSGGPALEFFADDTLVCMKEVFWSMEEEKGYDPIEVLLHAGVPAEKITWIVMLRNPSQVFASWNNDDPGVSPKALAAWQSYTLELFHHYTNKGVKMIPFAYELLAGQEAAALQALYDKIGLEGDISLAFDKKSIKEKFVPGQAADKVYFNKHIRATLNKGKMIYTTNNYQVPENDKKEVKKLCQAQYEDFFIYAKSQLGLK